MIKFNWIFYIFCFLFISCAKEIELEKVNRDLAETKVDSSTPVIINVTSTQTDRTYIVGETLEFQVIFDSSMVVSGTPILNLETGGTDRDATFVRVDNNNELIFSYTVQTGDMTVDLDYTSLSAISLAGGTIEDVAGNTADTTLTLPGAVNSLSSNKEIVIDGTAPAIAITSTTAINIANENTYTLSGTCAPDSVGFINIDIGGEAAASIDCAAGAWTHTYDVSGASDSLTLAVVANYGAGPLATDATTFLKDTVAPAGLTQTGVANSIAVTDRVITGATGACTDGETISITGDVETDLGPFEFTCTASTWNLNFALSRGNGAKNIVYNQTDAAGNPQVATIDHSYTFTGKTAQLSKVATNYGVSCFIHTDGRVLCAGTDGNYGRLGSNESALYESQTIPYEIDMIATGDVNNFKMISGGYDTICGINDNNKAYCWGKGRYGEIGDGALEYSAETPIEPNIGTNSFKDIDSGEGQLGCGVHTDGKLYCWGQNDVGQLGDGSGIDQPSPVEIDMAAHTDTNDFKAVSVGGSGSGDGFARGIHALSLIHI